MISRMWHGWTAPANADAYEKLLREEILPGIHRVHGFKGAQVLRRDLHASRKDGGVEQQDEVEFVVITSFDSIESIKQFAGQDYEVAVIEPAARKLLTRFDARTVLYDAAFELD